jgi:flagellar biosynthesis protein FlhG
MDQASGLKHMLSNMVGHITPAATVPGDHQASSLLTAAPARRHCRAIAVAGG